MVTTDNGLFEGAGIILAGGHASRMDGADKGRIIVDSRPLLDRNVEILLRLFTQVIIVTNAKRPYSCNHRRVCVAVDEQPDRGPLMGLYSGLKAAKYETNFVMACDMPHICEPLVKLMWQRAAGSDSDVVVPLVNGFREPLLAIYKRSVLGAIKKSIDSGIYKMVWFYDRVRVDHITERQLTDMDPEMLSLVNINTPHDLGIARGLFEESCQAVMQSPIGGGEYQGNRYVL